MNELATAKRVTAVKDRVKKAEFDQFVFGKLGCNRMFDMTPTGNLVHTYYGLAEYGDFIRFFNSAPFIQLNIGGPFAAEFVCERFLCSVTWTEYAIQVVFYESRELLLETIRQSQQIVINQFECFDNLPTGILLAFNNEIFHR